MRKYLLFFVMLILVVATVGAAVYKWVDETGTTHYSGTPGSGKKAEKVNMPPPPPKEVIEEAQRKFQESREEELRKEAANRSLSLSELGPLPLNASSEYVRTVGTGMHIDTEKLVTQFSIELKAKPNLPPGVYLETHFENPANPGKPIVVGEVWRKGAQTILILSPEFKGLKCRNYQVVVYVYTEKNKDKLLGIHRQIIQSRINLDKVRSSKELVDALMAGGNCP
jgi:hypothetical protein